MDGGTRVAEVLKRNGVEFIFTLVGGHISPVLVQCKRAGIRVIDTRHEVNTVFAADAVARITGVPGVAAVTAGPGVTNTITAIKNAQLAQSPLVLIGGATATMLRSVALRATRIAAQRWSSTAAASSSSDAARCKSSAVAASSAAGATDATRSTFARRPPPAPAGARGS